MNRRRFLPIREDVGFRFIKFWLYAKMLSVGEGKKVSPEVVAALKAAASQVMDAAIARGFIESEAFRTAPELPLIMGIDRVYSDDFDECDGLPPKED